MFEGLLFRIGVGDEGLGILFRVEGFRILDMEQGVRDYLEIG